MCYGHQVSSIDHCGSDEPLMRIRTVPDARSVGKISGTDVFRQRLKRVVEECQHFGAAGRIYHVAGIFVLYEGSKERVKQNVPKSH